MKLDDFYTRKPKLGLGAQLERGNQLLVVMSVDPQNPKVVAAINPATFMVFGQVVTAADESDLTEAETNALLGGTSLSSWTFVNGIEFEILFVNGIEFEIL